MFENPRIRQASKEFYNRCSENSRSQIVFRTDILRKLTLGAPGKSSWTAKAAFVASLQMAGVKGRHLQSRNVTPSTSCALQNKRITLSRITKSSYMTHLSYALLCLKISRHNLNQSGTKTCNARTRRPLIWAGSVSLLFHNRCDWLISLFFFFVIG